MEVSLDNKLKASHVKKIEINIGPDCNVIFLFFNKIQIALSLDDGPKSIKDLTNQLATKFGEKYIAMTAKSSWI